MPEPPPESPQESDHSFLPWLAMLVLLACWLAEASL
jgi:hypothetical protein